MLTVGLRVLIPFKMSWGKEGIKDLELQERKMIFFEITLHLLGSNFHSRSFHEKLIKLCHNWALFNTLAARWGV